MSGRLPTGGYAFSYECGQISILKIQIRILLNPRARLDPIFSVDGTHDTKTWCRSGCALDLGFIPCRCLGSMVDYVPGIQIEIPISEGSLFLKHTTQTRSQEKPTLRTLQICNGNRTSGYKTNQEFARARHKQRVYALS